MPSSIPASHRNCSKHLLHLSAKTGKYQSRTIFASTQEFQCDGQKTKYVSLSPHTWTVTPQFSHMIQKRTYHWGISANNHFHCKKFVSINKELALHDLSLKQSAIKLDTSLLYWHGISNHPHNAKRMHLIRYLAGNRDMKVTCKKSGMSELMAFCDSDWAACRASRKSQRCIAIQFAGHSLYCQNTMQHAVTLSSAEAEE